MPSIGDAEVADLDVVNAVVCEVVVGPSLDELAPTEPAVVRLAGKQHIDRRDHAITGRVRKERNAVAGSLGHGNDPMNRRLVTVIGPHLHGVGEVHHNGPRPGLNIDPAVLDRFCLESTSVVLQQQGEHSRVRVIAESSFPERVQAFALPSPGQDPRPGSS